MLEEICFSVISLPSCFGISLGIKAVIFSGDFQPAGFGRAAICIHIFAAVLVSLPGACLCLFNRRQDVCAG